MERTGAPDREIPCKNGESSGDTGAAPFKNPLESRGKGERAGGELQAAIGHSAIFAGIHASVPRDIYWKGFSLLAPAHLSLPPAPSWYTLGDRALARASKSISRAVLLLFLFPRPPTLLLLLLLLLYECTRPAALGCARVHYLPLSLNILNFIYGCSSRFIAVLAALFALTCFNVRVFFPFSCSP